MTAVKACRWFAVLCTIKRRKPFAIIIGVALAFLWSEAFAQPGTNRFANRWEVMLERFDTDKDGSVTRQEFRGNRDRFDEMDRNGDGKINAEDFRGRGLAPSLQGTTGKREMLNQRFGSDKSPEVGKVAPDFTLKRLNSEETVTLSTLYRDKPVVLTLGSYTCPPFRNALEGMEKIFQQHQDELAFLFVYIKEAHSTDERPAFANERLGINFTQPTTYDERAKIAATCQQEVKLTMPIVVDTLDNRVDNLYAGAPNRTYVIAKDGTVLYKGGRGPQGTKPDEVAQAINDLLRSEKTVAKKRPE